MDEALNASDLKPVISVIVPCYNGQAYIDECLESLNQQIVAVLYEVVFVDDGSTDASLKKAEAWVPRFSGDTRLRVLKNTINQGFR
mgnify:CR=1 FL=1